MDFPGRKWAWCVVLGLAVLAGEAAAGNDPGRRWRTLEAPGVRMHFAEPDEALARRMLRLATEGLAWLKESLGLAPSQPVEFVLEDFRDDSNGFTRVWPYNHVTLFAAPPGPDSELSVFQDYHRVLVLHELVHVVHMDLVGGVPRVLNRVFGKTLLPNGASPPWWIEGWATFLESRLNPSGRDGGTDFQRVLRTAALDGRFLSLSQMTVAPEDPPRGGAFYIYGGAFLSFLERRSGLSALVAFLREYGDRLVPFAMNTVARRTLGRDLEDLYQEFQQEVLGQARRLRDRRSSQGIVEGRVLTSGAESVSWPHYHPGGTGIWYVRSDGHREAMVVSRDLRTGRETPRFPCRGGCGRLAVQQGALLTTHQVPHRLYSWYGDVFRHETDGRTTRLTRQARARDLFVGDQDWFYVATRSGEVALIRQPPNREAEEAVPFGTFQDLGAGTVLPDGTVVFSGLRDGRWDLWVLGPDASAVPRRLTDDTCRDRNPAAMPDGRSLVFVSDPGGVDDLFLLDLATGRRRRLTRVLGGVRHPAVRPDGQQVAFATWTSRGWELAVLNLSDAPSGPSDPDEDACSPEASTIAMPEGAQEPTGPRPYAPWSSARPRALLPDFSWESGGAIRLGASIQGEDALGHLGWWLGIDGDLLRGAPGYRAGIAWHGTWPSLVLDFSSFRQPAYALLDGQWTPFDRRNWHLGLSASLPIPLRDRAFGVETGWSVTFFEANPRMVPGDPASPPPRWPRDGPEGRWALRVYHDETRAFAHSIGTAQGHREGVTATIRHPLNRQDGGLAWSLSASLEGFVPMPWTGDQVLSVRGIGALARGDSSRKSLYALGGLPAQDPWTAIWRRQPWSQPWLRGHPRSGMVGDAMTLWTVSWQVPLWSIHRGTGTFPLAARRLWASLFSDLGSAWDLGQRPDLAGSVGLEIALSLHLLQWFDGSIRLGYARGLGKGGEHSFYWLVGP